MGLDLETGKFTSRNAQRFAGQLLEMSDQLLASAHQPAVLEAAGGDASVDALDEHPVLLADLVVEGHELVDPRLVDVGPEEVVEEAVRPVGRQGDHRADRDVRPAREDVNAEIRPEEVELAPRQLAVEVHRRAAACAGRAALAGEAPVGGEGVRVRRHVQHLRELRVRDLAVVALEEVLADDLPVRFDLRLPARVEDEIVDVEPELGDLRRHRAERVGERFGVPFRVRRTRTGPTCRLRRHGARARPSGSAAPPPSAGRRAASRRARTSRRGRGTGASRASPSPRPAESRGGGRR